MCRGGMCVPYLGRLGSRAKVIYGKLVTVLLLVKVILYELLLHG